MDWVHIPLKHLTFIYNRCLFLMNNQYDLHSCWLSFRHPYSVVISVHSLSFHDIHVYFVITDKHWMMINPSIFQNYHPSPLVSIYQLSYLWGSFPFSMTNQHTSLMPAILVTNIGYTALNVVCMVIVLSWHTNTSQTLALIWINATLPLLSSSGCPVVLAGGQSLNQFCDS